MHSDTTACHSLPPICCCAYSLLVHPSNNGRRMRGNVSVSMAQPLRSHYYVHKSFRCPISPSLPPPVLFLALSISQTHEWYPHVFRRRNSKRTHALLRVLTLTSFWKNNRPSRRRRRRHPPEATLTAVIKECEGMCVCRHVPGCVCVCFFCHFHSLSAFVFSSRVPIFTF